MSGHGPVGPTPAGSGAGVDLPVAVTADGRLVLRPHPRPPFAEAFLADTAAAAGADHDVVVRPDRLHPPSDPPPGVVAHCGRSGSTLLCRLIEAVAPVATFREPEWLVDAAAVDDAPLSGGGGTPAGGPAGTFGAALAACSSAARAVGRRAVVKLPAPAAHLAARPGWSGRVLCLRHPYDVAASYLAHPSWWLVDELGMPPPNGAGTDPGGSGAEPSAPVHLDGSAVVRRVAEVWRAAAGLAAGPGTLVVTHAELLADPLATAVAAASRLGAIPSAVGATARAAAVEHLLGRDAHSGRPRPTPPPLRSLDPRAAAVVDEVVGDLPDRFGLERSR